jgi:hypothetical protein
LIFTRVTGLSSISPRTLLHTWGILTAWFTLFARKKFRRNTNAQVLYQFSVRLQAQPLNDVAEKQKATNNFYLWLSVKTWLFRIYF